LVRTRCRNPGEGENSSVCRRIAGAEAGHGGGAWTPVPASGRSGQSIPGFRRHDSEWSIYAPVPFSLLRVLDAAPWSPRLWFSAAVYRDRIWVLGGWSNNPSQNLGDVWYSQDGKRWTQLKSDVIWKARHEHSTFVFHDKLWVAGGHARPLTSDVWSLSVPPRWFDNY
jgi:hypothetical protein